jgi:hypothetical protein
MRDPITLLETIGADANLMSATAAQLSELLRASGMAPALRRALLEGDLPTFRELLRAPDVVCCLIDPAEEDDEEEEEEEEEEGDEEDEDDKGPARKPQPRGAAL